MMNWWWSDEVHLAILNVCCQKVPKKGMALPLQCIGSTHHKKQMGESGQNIFT